MEVERWSHIVAVAFIEQPLQSVRGTQQRPGPDT